MLLIGVGLCRNTLDLMYLNPAIIFLGRIIPPMFYAGTSLFVGVTSVASEKKA